MPSAADLRTYLLPHVGLSNVSLLPAAVSTAMLTAANQTLQQMFAGQQAVPYRLQVRAPATITVDVTAGAKTLTVTNGWNAAMLGCTIVIPGDPRQNRLVKSTSETVALLGPYQGSTATGLSALVYGDCLLPGVEIAQIYPPALLDNQYEIHPLTGADLLGLTLSHSVTPKNSERPRFYSLEDWLPHAATPGAALVFDSLPDTAYVLEFRARPAPPRLTDWADTRDYLLPNGMDASILYPWVRYNFRTHPNFITGETTNIQDIREDAARAQSLWDARTQGLTHTAIDTTSY